MPSRDILDLMEQIRNLAKDMRGVSRDDRLVIMDKIRKLRESRKELHRQQILEMRAKIVPPADFIDEQ